MSIPTISFFSFLLVLSFFIPQNYTFSKSITKEEMGLKEQQNLTHLHFYFHDYVQGPNLTAQRIAQAPNTDKTSSGFGALVMIDDPLTEGPEKDSKIVGYAQGMYGFADQKQPGLLMVMNLVFIEGEFNGSTLSVLGRNQVMNKVREMGVVGGSGVFRFATGYAQAKTITMLDKSGASVVAQTGGTVNSLNFAESKCKKVKGKLLDLELLAEMYIDSDEERSIEDVEFSKAPTPTTLPSNKRFKVGVETYAMASTAKRSLGPVLQGELLSPCSITGSKITLADLNEPLATSCLEESGGDKRISSFLEISEINHDLSDIENTISDGIADNVTGKPLAQSDKAKSEVGFATSGRKPSYSLGQIPLVVQALPSFDNQLTSSKGARNCGRRKGPINDKVDASLLCSPNFRVAKSLRSSCSDVKSKESVVCMSSKTSDLNCFDLNSVVMENSEFTPSDDTSNNGSSAEAETVKKSKICRMIDINLPCDFMTDEEPVIQDDKIVHDHENSGRLKLNFCMNDDSLQPKSPSLDKTQLEIDLEAPISPEVKERSPPRGDSEDNQSEEGSDLFLELAKIAADAIVSISSSSSQSYQENLGLRKCEASDSGNLEWFAGLINSLSSDLENDFDTMNCKDTCSIDDFEAMTLELPELKSEDFLCKSNVQISNETCLTVLPCQTRRGRTRRSKRKDFQREVLPSLASLSRYEVTEDIMMIEGLMEAAGTPWSLSKTRRACRTGRKPRAAKQPTFDEKVQELSALISWGKVNRRPRGRRSPASPTTISKWLGHDL